MTSILDTLVSQWRAFSPAELAAVVLALAYLLLVIRQNIWCWFCAAVSSAIYVWLFFAAKLYMDSVLSGFYVAMAIYGWRVWKRGGQDEPDLPVILWPMKPHIIAVAIILSLAATSGWFLSEFSDAAYPYIDSLTTFGALWATFLIARKVFENWWYWLLIDTVSIGIYWDKKLELTALLFVGYVILIPIGMAQWRRSYRSQATATQ